MSIRATFVFGLAWHALAALALLAAEPASSHTLREGSLTIANPVAPERQWIVRPEFFDDRILTTDKTDDPRHGPATRLQLQDDTGQQLEVVQPEQLPFTLLRATIHNAAAESVVHRSLDVVTLPIDLGVPVGELKVLGTGGLSDADSAPGSYMWLAVAHPPTRRAIVLGWITTERGSGALIPRVVGDRLEVTARLDFGRLQVDADESTSLETLAVGEFADGRDGLEAYADAVARGHEIRLPKQPCGYCTWYHAAASTAARVAKLAEFAAAQLQPFGFEVVQIDDGWQAGETKNGPRKNFTQIRVPGPYADGMAATAQQISRLGLTPGVWFMPFAGTWDDPFFRDKQEWFARRAAGEPFDTFWGGSCLDLTRTDVQAYLRENVVRLTREWGYKYLKMDGLFTGAAADIQYINDAYKDDQLGNATLSDPRQTHVQALRLGLSIVREAAGPDVFLLGCCAPQNMRSFGGAFGKVDAMRIGPDNGANVEGLLVGPRYGGRNYFLHGRVWWNDPDPVYVRPSLSRAQAELSCGWASIAGQLTIASDDFERLPPDRLDLLRRIMPAHGRAARPVDYFDHDLPQVWVIPASDRLPGHTVVGLFNWGAAELQIDEPLSRLGLDPAQHYAAYECWTGALWPTVDARLRATLAPLGDKSDVAREKETGEVPRASALLAIRPILDHPQLLSTSRHVTQGLVDVADEAWDDTAHTLRATSRLVANDPYELRLLAQTKAGNWKLVEFTTVESTDAGAIAIERLASDDPRLARVILRAPRSGSVTWRAKFAPANE